MKRSKKKQLRRQQYNKPDFIEPKIFTVDISNDGCSTIVRDVKDDTTIATIPVFSWQIQEMTGYKPKTTFYSDFSIADKFGVYEIADTFKRAFNDWKWDVEYLTELVMVLNWKTFEYYEKNSEYTELYEGLWEITDKWCMENLKGEDLHYYLRTTD